GYNLRNADAEGSGVDVDVTWAATERFWLVGNYTYLDTKYTDYEIIPAVGETEANDLTGSPRAGTPRNKLNGSVIYMLPIIDAGELSFRLDYVYNSKRLSARADVTENDPIRAVDSYD